jgi:dTDP-glucose pyrophosphorylase
MKVILSVPCEPAGGPAGCLPLVPLLDRPFVQHAVEVLAGRKLTEVHFVLGRHADAVERHLGTGARWGCTFHYHLTPDPDRPAGALAAAVAGAAGRSGSGVRW